METGLIQATTIHKISGTVAVSLVSVKIDISFFTYLFQTLKLIQQCVLFFSGSELSDTRTDDGFV